MQTLFLPPLYTYVLPYTYIVTCNTVRIRTGFVIRKPLYPFLLNLKRQMLPLLSIKSSLENLPNLKFLFITNTKHC